MKFRYALASIIFISALQSSAAQAQTVSERIAKAAEFLAETASASTSYQVKPGSPKDMIKELAMKESSYESEEDFEDNWVTNPNEAWEADSSNWAEESFSGARSYVSSAIDEAYDQSDKTNEDKINYAEKREMMRRGFTILRSIPSVRFGVAPLGAIQCGVTFGALLILDTASGKIHQISMEGSGC